MPPGMGNVGSGVVDNSVSGVGTIVRPVPSILLAMCMEGMGRSRYRLLSTVSVPMGHCDLPLSSCALPIDLCRVRVHLRWRGFGGSTSLRDLLARWAGPVPPNAQRGPLTYHRGCRVIGCEFSTRKDVLGKVFSGPALARCARQLSSLGAVG